MIYTDTDFEFDTSTGTVNGAVAVFEYDTEAIDRDPDCGYFTDRIEINHLELVSLQIGALILDRYTVEYMDKAALDRVEAFVTVELQEKLDAGELDEEPDLSRRELSLEAAE